MTAPVRLGLIGCGLISHAHGRAAQKSSHDITFSACASRSIERAREWADLYRCQHAYGDHREMLRNEALDGVVIATWPADHRQHIEDCIDAGIRFVLCEKALTVSSADAIAIFTKAAAAQVIVVEGFMYRHNAVMKAIHGLLPTLGRIDFIQATFNMRDTEEDAPAEQTPGWRRRPECGGGVPFDFTCYPIDAANLLARSAPRRVFACMETSERFRTIDRFYGLIEYANSCRASFESSRRAVYSQALAISGTEGRLCVPTAWTPLTPVTVTVSSSNRFLTLEDAQIVADDGNVERLIDLPAFQRQLENFAAVVRGRSQPEVSAIDSLANARVLDAALASASSGRSVEIQIA